MKNAYAFSFCIMTAAAVFPGMAMAAEGVPEWVCSDVSELAAAGYVRLPARNLHALSRGEMAVFVSRALKYVDDHNLSMDVDRSGAVARNIGLTAQDDAQYKLLQEKVHSLQTAYNQALRSVPKNTSGDGDGTAGKRIAALKRELEEAQGIAARRAFFLQQEKATAQAGLPDKKMDAAMQKSYENARRSAERLYREEALGNREKPEMLQAIDREKRQQEVLRAEDLLKSQASGQAGPSLRGVAANDLGTQLKIAQALRVEFYPELTAMGYFDDEAAQQQAEIQVSPRRPLYPNERLQIDGELRVDYSHNMYHGITADRSRARARIYYDYNFDNNWHLKGMMENSKVLKGDGLDNYVGGARYYLQGYIGPVLTRVGMFSTTMAEGNIYDSKFKGLKLEVGSPVHYTINLGDTDPARNFYTLEADYNTLYYSVGAGIYRANMVDGGHRNIYMMKYHIPVGVWDMGFMYLRGQDDIVGNGNGYVFSLARGREIDIRPGSYHFFFKYYYQPRSTYIQHTMNGLADSMNGFKGPGIGIDYTIAKNIVGSLEYDHLRDLSTNEHYGTLWGAITYYFSNHN